jgi:cyclic pyranopterin phosphate synthase
VAWKPHGQILTYEEITEVVAAAAHLGIKRLRLTGGEPLVRRGLVGLVGTLGHTQGIEEISLSTNGILLERLAHPLAEAGLKRVNISLDTLKAERFQSLTLGGDLQRVWRGIAAAENAGLQPIKLNAVVVWGTNEDELVDLARLSVDNAWRIRFIELMPVGAQGDWGEDLPTPETGYVSVKEMRRRLVSLQLQPEEGILDKGRSGRLNGPARIYRIPWGKGAIGFISALGQHFCASCNRLRLTADGFLRPCLLGDLEVEIRQALRKREPIDNLLRQAVELKPRMHELARSNPPTKRLMAKIGG